MNFNSVSIFGTAQQAAEVEIKSLKQLWQVLYSSQFKFKAAEKCYVVKLNKSDEDLMNA